MVILADGDLQVNPVASRLGYGLDEAATRAAQQIKFRPAILEGQPVDFLACVLNSVWPTEKGEKENE